MTIRVLMLTLTAWISYIYSFPAIAKPKTTPQHFWILETAPTAASNSKAFNYSSGKILVSEGKINHCSVGEYLNVAGDRCVTSCVIFNSAGTQCAVDDSIGHNLNASGNQSFSIHLFSNFSKFLREQFSLFGESHESSKNTSKDICNGNNACNVVMHHIIPTLGILTSLGIHLSLWKEISGIVERQKLGPFNLLNSVALSVNCLAWIIYALLVQNYYIFVPNFMGISFSLFYTLNVFHLADENRRNSLRNILLIGYSFCFLGGLVCFVSLANDEFSIRKTVGGWMILFISIMVFFASPLSGLANAITTRNASSISFGMSAVNALNATLWAAYGFAINDIFVYGPNLLGCLTVIVQIVLILLFKNRIVRMKESDMCEMNVRKETMSGCPFNLSSLASKESCVQALPQNLGSCQGNICTGAIMDRNCPQHVFAEKDLTNDEIWIDAKQFLTEFYTYHDKTGLQNRLEAVKQQIFSTGAYIHTYDELRFGVQTAWRNSSRCIYRIQWKNIHVFDCRDVDSPEKMFEACVDHLRFATNGGNIKSTLTIFPARLSGTRGPRIWNPQLIRYAGYRLPDGSILGDPAHVEITKVCLNLGWNPPKPKTRFDILPLICEFNDRFICRDLPEDSVMQVPLEHPTIPAFKNLGLKWHAVPAISNFAITIGGICYSAAPFNGWYMSAEIGARNLCDEQRYNVLPDVAALMNIPSSSHRSLWKDRALIEVNTAVIHSYDKNGVSIVDHHSASEAFMAHFKMDSSERGIVPGDWVWLVPPISGSTTSVFHQEMVNLFLKPNFIPFRDPSHLILNTLESFNSKQNTAIAEEPEKISFLKLDGKFKSLKIYYATETGKSLVYASRVQKALKGKFGLQDIPMVPMKDSPQVLVNDQMDGNFVIIVTSTFGNGEPPKMARCFIDGLKKDKYPLTGLPFSIFGLCNSSYATYNKCALNLSKRLKFLGAKEEVNVGFGDEIKDFELNFQKWLECIFLVLQGIQPDPSDLPTSPVQDIAAIASKMPEYTESTCFLKAISVLVPNEVFHLEIQTSKELYYLEGDHFSVLPGNHDQSVNDILNALNVDYDYICACGSDQTPIKIGDILKYLANLDSFPELELLQFYLNELESLLSPAKQNLLKHISFLDYLIKNRNGDIDFIYSVKDLIVDSSLFYQVRSIDDLIRLLPVMLPRTYSIASCRNYADSKELHLTVKLSMYEKCSQVYKGKCSGYLTSLMAGDRILGRVREYKRFRLPERLDTKETRLVFIGNGTGIAPFRSFIQRIAGQVQWMMLYGVRNEASFLYKDEFEAVENGIIGVAYSRATKDKIYVQDLITDSTEYGKLLKSWVSESSFDTIIYVCGSHAMGKAVYDNMEELLGHDRMNQLKSQGKYLEDTY